jgi:MSHA biogenesis protein MshO
MGPDIANDGAPGCAPSATCSAPLDISQPVTTFDVLSPMSTTPVVGDWVVIDNQNPNDAYTAGINRGAITGLATPRATDGQRRISVTAGTVFPNGYDGGRFVVVSNNGGNPAIFYVCAGAGIAGGTGTGTLYRLVRPFSAAYPAACPGVAGAALLATHVSSCTFVYDPAHGATQQSGFVWMQLELTEAGETVALSYGAHVENVP